tara:strand:- start:434 stop:565 length:132 start_codon:yes stop_codon:yes gene_type:complete
MDTQVLNLKFSSAERVFTDGQVVSLIVDGHSLNRRNYNKKKEI